MFTISAIMVRLAGAILRMLAGMQILPIRLASTMSVSATHMRLVGIAPLGLLVSLDATALLLASIMTMAIL